MNNNEELQLIITKIKKNLEELEIRLDILADVSVNDAPLSVNTQLNKIDEIMSNLQTSKSYFKVVVKDSL